MHVVNPKAYDTGGKERALRSRLCATNRRKNSVAMPVVLVDDAIVDAVSAGAVSDTSEVQQPLPQTREEKEVDRDVPRNRPS